MKPFVVLFLLISLFYVFDSPVIKLLIDNTMPNWLAILGWTLAFLIGWRTVKANIVSANAAKGAVEIAEKALKIDKRGYLIIPQPGLIDFYQSTVTITYTIENIGSTYVRIKTPIDIGITLFQGQIIGVGRFMVPPLKVAQPMPASPPWQFIPSRMPWTVTYEHSFEREKIQSMAHDPDIDVVVHGILIYFDIFMEQHFTRFCWRYDGAGLINPGFVPPVLPLNDFRRRWEMPPEYNEAD